MAQSRIDRPVIRIERSGVFRVAAADIIRSRIGQEEIQKAALAAIALRLREPSPVGAAANGR